MSLDLTLLPYGFPDHDYIHYSHTVLPLQTNNRGLMAAIEQLARQEQPQSITFIKGEKKPSDLVEDDFACYIAKDKQGDTCYGEVKEDAYGKPLRWIRVSELLKVDKVLWRNPQDKSALAFLSTMDKDHRVALYWS